MTAVFTPVFPSGSPPEILPPPPSPPFVTKAADLDRMLHAWQSRFTGGRSPSTARVSPASIGPPTRRMRRFRRRSLGRTAMAQWRRLCADRDGRQKRRSRRSRTTIASPIRRGSSPLTTCSPRRCCSARNGGTASCAVRAESTRTMSASSLSLCGNGSIWSRRPTCPGSTRR